MRKLVFDPGKSGRPMKVVCFISGSGTNYREIVSGNPRHRYLVFTNRPGCAGEAVARGFNHEVIHLSHEPFFAPAKSQTGRMPERNSPLRLAFDREAVGLIRSSLGGEPDLVCMAGYDLLLTDWLVEQFADKMINVHPGDTTRGYTGLGWIPSAKAVLAGEEGLRSTLFFVEKIMDTGPILLQSAPLSIAAALARAAGGNANALEADLQAIREQARREGIASLAEFRARIDPPTLKKLEQICLVLQNQLKEAGDWAIYPLAVSLIGEGRVEIDDRRLYLDGRLLPEYGFRPDQTPL